MPSPTTAEDPVAVLDRLEAAFGRDPIHAMLRRFAEQLQQALADGDGTADAHRVAGTAGTLGFAALGRAWLMVADGDGSALDQALRESRTAIEVIDRRLEKRPSRSTSV